MAGALSPEPPGRARRPRTVSPRSRTADPAAAARLSQTGRRPGGSPSARRRRRGGGLKSPELARELFRIESSLAPPGGDDAAALYERRLLHAHDPHGTPSKRGSRGDVGGTALQAKHAAARARSALMKTHEATAPKDGGGGGGGSDSRQTYRVALRDFARQQREAEREWERLIDPGNAEDTWTRKPSPQREPEPEPEPEPEQLEPAPQAPLEPEPELRPVELWLQESQDARVNDAVAAALRSAEAEKAAALSAVRDQHRRDVEVEMAVSNAAAQRAAELDEEKAIALAEAAEVKEALERASEEVEEMRERETQLIVKVVSAEDAAAAATAAAAAAVAAPVAAPADAPAAIPPLDSPRRIAAAAADALTRAATAEAETMIAKASLRRSSAEMETLKARELELTTQLKVSAEETAAAVAASKSAVVAAQAAAAEVKSPPRRPPPRHGGQVEAQAAAEEAAAAYASAADDARARATHAEAETEAAKTSLTEASAHLAGLQDEHRLKAEQLEALREEHRAEREEAEALAIAHADDSRRWSEWEADMQTQVEVITSERKSALADAVRANRATDVALQDAKALRAAVRDQEKTGGGGSAPLSVCAWIGIVIVVAFVMYCAGAVAGHAWKCEAAADSAIATAQAATERAGALSSAAAAAQSEAELQAAALRAQLVSMRTQLTLLEAIPPPMPAPPPPPPPPVAVEASRLAVYRGCEAEWRIKDAAERKQHQHQKKKQPVVVVYEWSAPVFSPCSVECGQREVVQIRLASCLSVAARQNRSRIARDESQCEASIGAKPAGRTVCPSTPACADAEAEEQEAEALRRSKAEEIDALRAAETVAAVASVQAVVESREVHIAALQEHITDVELELSQERDRCADSGKGEGREICADCETETGTPSQSWQQQTMAIAAAMLIGSLLAFLWHSTDRNDSQARYDQKAAEIAALQKELDETLRQRKQREDQAAKTATEAARAAATRAAAATAEEWERQRMDDAAASEHLLDQLSESEADNLEQEETLQSLRAQCAELERQRQSAKESSVTSSHTRFETEADFQVQQTEHKKQLADAQADSERLTVEIDALHRRCTVLEAEKSAAHELVKQRDGEFFKKIAMEAHEAGQTAAGKDIALRRTLSDVERACRELEEEKRKAELELEAQRQAAETELAAQRKVVDVGEVAKREEVEQRLAVCSTELETQRFAAEDAEMRAAAQVTAALYEQQQQLYAAAQSRPPPMSPLSSPAPRASSAAKQVNVILRLRKVRTLAVLNTWAEWSARQQRLRRLCNQQLGRRTRHLVGVMFVAWMEARREAAHAVLLTERGAERAELQRRMDEQAIAASETADLVYAAVEEERATHQVKIQQLQAEVQTLREAHQAAPSPRTMSLSVEAAVAAAVADVTRAAEEATAAAVLAAKEEARSLAEEEMSALTPRESARVKLARREAELESKATAAVDEVRRACESEASTQLAAAQTMAQTMMEQAAKDAQAAKLEAELTLRATAAAELTTAEEKLKELEGLLRGSREEFNELEEKLKGAAADFHSAAEEAARVQSKKAVEDAEETWERQTHEQVWLAVQEAEGKAAEAMAVVEAEAEASTELAVAEAMLEAMMEAEVEKDQAVEEARRLAEEAAAVAVAAAVEAGRTQAEEEMSSLTPRDSAEAKFAAREAELESTLEDLREEVAFVQEAGSEIEEQLAEKTQAMVKLEAELVEAERQAEAAADHARSTEQHEVAAAKAWGEELLGAERANHASQSERARLRLVEIEEAAYEEGEKLSSLQEKCALKLSMKMMVGLLRAWSGLAKKSIRQMRVLGLLFSKREDRAVGSTFLKWQDAVRELRCRRVVLTRTVLKMSHRQISNAWGSWAGVVAAIREQRLVDAHREVVTTMETRVHEARMSHLTPRTHLHCKTCHCQPRNKAERQRTVSSPAAAAAAAANTGGSPFAALGQYSPSSLVQALGGGGDGSSSDGDAHTGLRLGTGHMIGTELLQSTPPPSPSRRAGEAAAPTTPGGSPARSSSTASVASPARSAQSDRSSRSSRRPPRRRSSGEERDSFMKF